MTRRHTTDGFRAAEQGLPESSCPHPVGSKARNDWRKGFWNHHQGKKVNGVMHGYKNGEQAFNRTPTRVTMRTAS